MGKRGERKNDTVDEEPTESKNVTQEVPEEDVNVDRWKTLTISPEDVNADGGPLLLEESSFATLFPQYREKYLRQVLKSKQINTFPTPRPCL
jgi:ribosomal RNA assembly protein